jgi:hypothetical protein
LLQSSRWQADIDQKDFGGTIIEILGATLHRRSMFEKREKIFQLISTLFCEVKGEHLYAPEKLFL